ncbi:MAG: PrsW family glutamic-type intramembrane protease [Parcubacteria group bacterium]|jgi:hypothetical protein
MPPIKSLFLGILAALFALFFELSFSLFFPEEKQVVFFAHFSIFLILSALVEETVKYAVIYKSFSVLEKRRSIIFGGFLVGLGFSAAELSLNYYGKINLISVPFYFLLGMISVHIFTSIFAAMVISKKQNRYFMATRVLIFNSVIHILYNLAVIYLL